MPWRAPRWALLFGRLPPQQHIRSEVRKTLRRNSPRALVSEKLGEAHGNFLSLFTCSQHIDDGGCCCLYMIQTDALLSQPIHRRTATCVVPHRLRPSAFSRQVLLLAKKNILSTSVSSPVQHHHIHISRYTLKERIVRRFGDTSPGYNGSFRQATCTQTQ